MTCTNINEVCMQYISQKLVDKLNEYLTSETVTLEISNNLQQIYTMIEDLNRYYAEENWGQVAINIRKLSDFTKTLYSVSNIKDSLQSIVKKDKWVRIHSISHSKSIEQIDKNLEELPDFKEIESSRDYANAELHINANTKPLIIDLQMLPSQQAINFLVNIAIEGANYQEPENKSITTIEWKSIFNPIKITDKAREELEKPTTKKYTDKVPLDKFREQQIISDDIIQHLFNNKDIQYIDKETEVFELLKYFWDCNWTKMRKTIGKKLSNIKKEDTPFVYYQLKLSEAWTLMQLEKTEEAIDIWIKIEKECPKDYPQIRKLILINLRSISFSKFSSTEKIDINTIYNELQQYIDIDIDVAKNIRFDKSNILSTINEEFNFKYGKTVSLGQDTRQFFLYKEYLPQLIKNVCTALEKGMFFMLPELIEDLIDLSIMQYQYYGGGNQQYFYMLHNIARNICGLDTTCLQKYLNIVPLWDLQNHKEEIQPLVDKILSSKELTSIDLNFLQVIVPILNDEQQSEFVKKAREFFINPKEVYRDSKTVFGLWEEYLQTYFTILEGNQSLWNSEQSWIIKELCYTEEIQYNNTIPCIENLILKTNFTIHDELQDILCDSIFNYKNISKPKISEYDIIVSISNIYGLHKKKLPLHYQNIFRKYPSLWLYNNRDTMPEITTDDIIEVFEDIKNTMESYYTHNQKYSTNIYSTIPKHVNLYLSLIEKHKEKINYEQSYKDIKNLWTSFLDFCIESELTQYKLLLEIQSSLISFSSENKLEKYKNIEYYMDFNNWKNKLIEHSISANIQKEENSIVFLGAILHHIYNINNVDIDDFHEILNIIQWYQYYYCMQGIANWEKSIPEDIKQLLKIKILDIVSFSQKELIDINIISVYKILFKDEESIKSLQKFKNICSFPLYYKIEEK